MSNFDTSALDSTYSPKWTTGSGSVCQNAGDAFKSVLEDIAKLDLKELGVSEYNQIYIQTKLRKPHYEMCVASYMLGEFTNHTGSDHDNAVLVDYGAGSGLACFAAKRLGIKHVVYCDIFEQSCKDAKLIGDAIGVTIDQYVCGDLPDTHQWIRSNGLQASGVISHNVIEHVYSMNELFDFIGQIAERDTFVWLSTAANPFRKKTQAELAKHANRVETQTREPAPGHKERNALEAYRDIRHSIVKQARPELDDETLNLIADRTRGMRQDDILAFLASYTAGDTITIEPDHPTNTCDPLTGNWAERMMDPFQLVQDAKRHDLDLQVRPGLWSLDDDSFVKNTFKKMSNAAIAVRGNKGLARSPYYILCGTANGHGNR